MANYEEQINQIDGVRQELGTLGLTVCGGWDMVRDDLRMIVTSQEEILHPDAIERPGHGTDILYTGNAAGFREFLDKLIASCTPETEATN